MDRRSRRYTLSSESLEGRQLLSTTTGLAPASAGAVNGTTASINPLSGSTSSGVQLDEGTPALETIQAKEHHITNLPFFIGMLNKDGFVPQPAVANIQKDLLTFVASLHEGNSSILSSFNLDLRKAEAYENITPDSNATLNHDFGAALFASGVPQATVTDLQNQLNTLVQYDSTQVGSTIAATNDYGTVLQLALGSGRPLVYPDAPSLEGTEHVANNGTIAITHSHRPTLVGSYTIGTSIQIVSANGTQLLGQANVDKTTGQYSVRFFNYLGDGIYHVRVRGEDSGYNSSPSTLFTFEIKTPPATK
jgi:hypothetical protein